MMSITIPGHWETYLLDHERIIDALSKKDPRRISKEKYWVMILR